ncbi:hypothetical protein JCM5350_003026 [Sporobolomyces pararoseus]
MGNSTASEDHFPLPLLKRPTPPIGSSSDDSISTVATDSTVHTDIFPLTFPHLASSPYSGLVYTPPVREKDQFIDDEGLLSKRFDGLGIEERAEAESTATKYGDYGGRDGTGSGDPGRRDSGPSSAFASFAFPPSNQPSGPLRHTSLPAIVTSATPLVGFSATSPIDQSPAATFLPPYPTSSAALLSGSAISSTPDGSPGQSPTLSNSPLPATAEATTFRVSPRHQPFHQRAATTSSGSSSVSPRTSTSHHLSGMARSGSTPNTAFPSSSSSSSSSFLQSPVARSASYNPPWAVASAGNRPGSAGTTSTTGTSTSCRPWVFDSDASSVCSANSAGWSSGGGSGNLQSGSMTKTGSLSGVIRERRMTEDGEEFELDEGGEVFKPESDVEFLDHRPEPPGAKLSINRDDPQQVVLKVTLPGFSLDNITVAMRRGHKVHIVADSYGEAGGHFEKLIHLGSDVSSTAPRAEFNGTDLNVYIQRRPSRPSSSASTAGGSTAALPPFGALPRAIPGSPSSTFSSPDLDSRRPSSIASSFASAWSLSENGSSQHSQRDSISAPYPLSPSLEYPTLEAGHSDERRRSIDLQPHTVVAPPLSRIEAESRKSKSKCLTGPEGAKAAAKAAREEAAMRAKEEAKKLPSSARGGRRLPFRRQKEDGTFSGSSGSAGEGSAGEGSGSGTNEDEPIKPSRDDFVKKDSFPHALPPVEERQGGIERNGTIKASSRSSSPLPPPSTYIDSSTSSSDFSSSASSATSSSVSSGASSPNHSPPRIDPRPLPLFTNPSNPQNTHPRPKMREGNLTLRAPDGSSFVTQAQHQWASRPSATSSGNESEMEGEGDSLTPRWEQTGMKFTSS